MSEWVEDTSITLGTNKAARAALQPVDPGARPRRLSTTLTFCFLELLIVRESLVLLVIKWLVILQLSNYRISHYVIHQRKLSS